MGKTAEELSAEVGEISAQIRGIAEAKAVQMKLVPHDRKLGTTLFGFTEACEAEVRAGTLMILNKYRAGLVMELARASGMIADEDSERAPLLALPKGAVPLVDAELVITTADPEIVAITVTPSPSMVKTEEAPPPSKDKKTAVLVQEDAQSTFTRDEASS